MPSRRLQSSSSDGDGFESSSTAPRCCQVIRGRGRGGLGLRGRGRGHNIRGPPAIPSVPVESLEGTEIEKNEVSQVSDSKAKKSLVSIPTVRAKLENDSRMEMATAPLGRITSKEKKDENKTKVTRDLKC